MSGVGMLRAFFFYHFLNRVVSGLGENIFSCFLQLDAYRAICFEHAISP